MPTLMRCDFCGSPFPLSKFANPHIYSHFFQAELLAGHFAACVDCAILMEDGRFTDLVERALAKPEYRSLAERVVELRLELTAIYSQISRKREVF